MNVSINILHYGMLSTSVLMTKFKSLGNIRETVNVIYYNLM